MSKTAAIQTQLVGRTAKVRTGMFLPKWMDKEGLPVVIESAYIVKGAEGEAVPWYTISLPDGTMEDVPSFFFILDPLPPVEEHGPLLSPDLEREEREAREEMDRYWARIRRGRTIAEAP